MVQLCERLDEQQLGARRLDLICHRVDDSAQAVRVGLATPVRDLKRLTRLLCEKIETIAPGFGIEVMTLAATVAEPLTPRQTVTSLMEETAPDVSDLVDILANRVGERAIYRLAPVASDVPERSVCRISAMAQRRAQAGLNTGRGHHACCRGRNRSRPSRCCRITHQRPLLGVAFVAA